MDKPDYRMKARRNMNQHFTFIVTSLDGIVIHCAAMYLFEQEI